jgi:tetratricopeptide (TPR) repeat protein
VSGGLPAWELRRVAGEVLRLLGTRRFDDAQRALDDALTVAPESARLLALLAELRRRQGHTREAEALVRRAEAADPEDAQAAQVRAELHFERGEFERAAEIFRRLVDRGAGAYTSSRLVKSLARAGRLDEAAESARQALERHPDDRWLLADLAHVEARRGRHDEALRLQERLVERHPGDARAYSDLMRLRASTLPHEEAGAALQGLMRAGGRARNPHLRLAAADEFRKAGRDAEAAAEYEAALELEPGDAFALAQLGFCYKRLGRTDEAVETLRRALLRDPRDRYVRVSLGSLCRGTGRVSDLLRWIEEALKLHPDVGELYGFRNEVLKRLRAEDPAAAAAAATEAAATPAPRRRNAASAKPRPAR